jgi:hypothetical protein
MAVGVNIVSTFDSKGISRAISDFKKLDGAGNKATFALRTFDKGMTNTIKSVAKVGAAVGAAAGIIGFKLASAAYESQKVMAQTTAIIKATGGAAGVTATQVSNLSEKLAMQIGVDDELIQKSANLLLTFKQVQNQTGLNNNIFDRAVISAQDLGNVFGSADAAAMQLGKALSDPEKGITALRRAGINFTEAQKEQIKTLVQSGDILGAQKLILAEVESQVGGTAAATATGFDRMRVAMGNVAEEFGAILIPYIEKFANFVVQKVVPYLTKLADVIGEKGLGAGIKMLAGDFLKLTANMGTFGNVLLGLVTLFTLVRAVTIAATISQNLFNVALLANPIGITIAYFIALGVILAGLYIKFAVVREAVGMIGAALKFVFMNTVALVFNYFVTYINVAITGINLLIKAANFFGADIEEVGKLGYMAFTGIGSAAKSAKAEISGVAERTGAKAAKEGGVQKVVQALKDVSGAAGGTGGTGGAAKAVETATQKLEKYIDALKGLTSAQRSYRDAGKAALKSDQDLLTAKNRLVTAQTKFNNVLNGYGANSVQAGDAQSELAKAQREVTRAGFDVQKSVFAVADAEKELRNAYASGDSQQITEAQIALAEAQLAVSDATDAQEDSVKNLTTKQTLLDEAINGAATSSDTFKDAAQELKDAQDGLVDATDQQTDAYERQKDMLDALNESTRKAIKLRGGVVPKDAVAAETKVGVSPMAGASGGLYGSFIQAVQALHPNAPSLSSKTPVADSRLAFPKLYAQYKAAGLAMAKGGIITQPTQILAGESGAEAIIPLDRLQSGSTINITVNAGMGSDGTRIGQMIVNELQAYQRRVGSLPLKVSS